MTLLSKMVRDGKVRFYHAINLSAVRDYLLYTIPDEPELDSHQVCQLIINQFPGKYNHIRGMFNGREHSWLEFVDTPDIILDPYPDDVASGPIMLNVRGIWKYLYNSTAHEFMLEIREKIKMMGYCEVQSITIVGVFGSYAEFERRCQENKLVIDPLQAGNRMVRFP